MPTYEYECTSCGLRFEKFQSIKDDPVSVCPDCKGSVKRLISAGIGIIFKGSGFYTTDYKKSSKSTGTNGKKTKSTSSENKTTETKKETKSETKKESKKEPSKTSS